jgi:hypothetical protein
MSNGVEFDVDSSSRYAPRPGTTPGNFSPTGNEPKMVKWLMKKGIVKSPRVGQAVLIAVVIVNIIITIAVIKYVI